MPQEDNNTVNKTKSKASLALLIVIGSGCILQFIVIGVINIIRGYSIASYLPVSIFLIGFLIFGVVLTLIYRKKRALSSFFSITASCLIMGICLISISQGRYLKEAEGYYNACQYQQALQACEKEAGTWYHLLRYNHKERKAMNLMAETYCQFEDFDSARDTYKLMIDRYAGEFYGGRAEKSLEKLDKGLEVVAYYPDRIAESPLPKYMRKQKFNLDSKHNEMMVLFNIARTYKHALNCHTKAFEVYTRIIDMDVSEDSKGAAKGRILELRVAGKEQ